MRERFCAIFVVSLEKAATRVICFLTLGLGRLRYACLHTLWSQLLVPRQAFLWPHFNSTVKSSPTAFLGNVPPRRPLTFSGPRLSPAASYQTRWLGAAPGFKLLAAGAWWSVCSHARHLTRYLTCAGSLNVTECVRWAVRVAEKFNAYSHAHVACWGK